MKKKNLFVLILFFAGCAEKEVHALSNSNLPSNQLDGVHLGDKFDDIFNKNNIIVQNYKDISNVKDCEKSKNLIIKDNQTNIDVDERGMVTAINTTNPNAIDANGISVGENEKQLFKLKNIIKTKKMDAEEGGSYYEYKILSQHSNFYYIYTANHQGKIDSIGLFSKDYISCYED
ncbi:hypothetical protein NYY74_09530 [Acinetobacter baumannii]|uniref:hypothetical protein n=1 Tax=Acinetobacter baumannii TaxID=470 RepID=UPI0018A899FE|nr:hypothetical protein [Acinetobacter baumannii]EKU0939554.1 hypothetical protein [Acinetobacter baumannii]EKX7141655.1 hypothetical protein [Acinetobacter baumannii]MCZ2945353.1 hypothetical protein [Acinetobacter baumannii]MCZ3333037.1 hypothetical protein [Acinetobacter baumannii]